MESEETVDNWKDALRLLTKKGLFPVKEVIKELLPKVETLSAEERQEVLAGLETHSDSEVLEEWLAHMSEEQLEQFRIKAVLRAEDKGWAADEGLKLLRDIKAKIVAGQTGLPIQQVKKRMAVQDYPVIRREAPALFLDPTEDKVMEALNDSEYMQEEMKRDATTGLDIDDAFLTAYIRELQRLLAELQGGKLDRFGLRTLSPIELEHRLEETESDIRELEGAGSAPFDFNWKAGKFGVRQAVNRILEELGPTPSRRDLYLKKRLASELRLAVKLKRTEPHKRSAPSEIEEEVRRITAVLKTVAALRAERDRMIEDYPEDQDLIRRQFGKAIDSLKER